MAMYISAGDYIVRQTILCFNIASTMNNKNIFLDIFEFLLFLPHYFFLLFINFLKIIFFLVSIKVFSFMKSNYFALFRKKCGIASCNSVNTFIVPDKKLNVYYNVFKMKFLSCYSEFEFDDHYEQIWIIFFHCFFTVNQSICSANDLFNWPW